MGFLDVLFGRSKLRQPDRDRFFSIITAVDSLLGREDITPTGKAGIIFKPVDSGFFQTLETELKDLLQISGRATGTRFEVKEDAFGSRWVTLEDQDFGDLVATAHLIGETIADHGFADRLLAAVFQFRCQGKNAYWIYNYKRGRFYPLALAGPKERDNAAEMRLGALMEKEKMPVEKELEQWYALWGIPF